MKRDLDLIRDMMLRIEEHGGNKGYLSASSFGDICQQNVAAYHLRILLDAGFIDAIDCSCKTGEDYYVSGLTFAGSDYLDKIRSDSIWHDVLDKLSILGGTAALDTVKQIAVAVIRSKLGI